MIDQETGIEIWRYDDEDAPKDQAETYKGAVGWKNLPDGKVVVMYPMIFNNVRLCTGEQGVESFDRGFCYPAQSHGLALAAFYSWDGTGDPPEGWVKEAGTNRRRPDGTAASEVFRD